MAGRQRDRVAQPHRIHAGRAIFAVVTTVVFTVQATWNLFHAIGLTPSFLREARRGMAAVEQQLFYLRELHAGAVVTVHTAIDEVKEKLIVFTHVMTNDDTGEVAARTILKGVHMDTVQRKSCPFAPEILVKARSLVAPRAPAT